MEYSKLFEMRKTKIINNLKNFEMRDNEDLPILDFLNTLDKNKSYTFLEVGSGLCRFVDKIKDIYPNLDIVCFEINPDLAEIAISKGYNVINGDILKNTLNSNQYDIVHCSHVIEHFKYPDIIFVIDELLRITKLDAYCIIRTPLMSYSFYFDIDHVRPYPPEAIINYLNNVQQQKKGKNKIEIEKIWYRTEAKQYCKLDKNSFFFILPFRSFINKRIDWINIKFIESWNKYRFPATKPNGYVMITKKIS